MDVRAAGRTAGGEPDAKAGRVSRRAAWLALLLIVPAQSLGVAAMLMAMPGPSGMLLNFGSRLWMLALPLAWTLGVERRRPRPGRPTRRGLAAGVASGLAIFLVMVAAYALVRDAIDAGRLRERARLTGFDDPARFAAMLGFIVLANSLLEEYVWRWFVYVQAERLMPVRMRPGARRSAAVLVAASLFTVHHVVALSAWVGAPLVILGSVGVFLGAVIWSALYAADRTLWPCYVSHVLADLAILAIGWDLLFRGSG